MVLYNDIEEKEINELKEIVKECNVYINWDKVVCVLQITKTDEVVTEYRIITDF